MNLGGQLLDRLPMRSNKCCAKYAIRVLENGCTIWMLETLRQQAL